MLIFYKTTVDGDWLVKEVNTRHCPVCQKYSVHDMTDHINKRLCRNLKMKCPKCFVSFNRASNLRHHLSVTHKLGAEVAFKTVQNVLDPSFIARIGSVVIGSHASTSAKKFDDSTVCQTCFQLYTANHNCGECKYAAYQLSMLLIIVLLFSNFHVVWCELCKKGYQAAHALNKHNRRVHGADKRGKAAKLKELKKK